MVRLERYFNEIDLPDVLAVCQSDPVLRQWLMGLEEGAYFNFQPRPDRPAEFDEQHSFCYNRDPVSFLIGGNAAGTTEAAAYKSALFMLRQQPPPRKDTPFWIISNTYDQVCDVCWSEKLIGHGHIPECEVEWDRISWLDKKAGRPKAVPLLPWPESRGGDPDKNWRIEFKSYEQGRQALQARSIGGFWFSEQFPLDVFLETLRGCREYMYGGGQFAEFTPIDPELCLWVEALMEAPPDGWKFYRANTECNKSNLADGWYEQFFATVPDELLETRKTGALATFEGVIYQSFNRNIHVIPAERMLIPPGVFHGLATDWGASEEHPHATVWGYRDGKGDWWIYDEYWSIDQSKITRDHAEEIVLRCKAWGWPTEELTNHRDEKYLALKTGVYYTGNVADPGRPGEIQEFNQRGIPTLPACNDVYEGINAVRELLKVNPFSGRPRIFISSRCKHLIDELRKYRWRKAKRATGSMLTNPQVAAPVPLKRDDDTADALRYLIYSDKRARGSGIGTASTEDIAKVRKSVQRASGQSESPAVKRSHAGRGRPGWFKEG
jgi:hypothetical protein